MRVLNKHTATKEDLAGSIYIGRGSPLGNPYIIGIHGDLDQVLKMYRTYLVNKLISRDPAIETAMRNLTPDSKIVCFCAPKPCHGNIIEEFWNDLQGEGTYEQRLLKFKDKHSLDKIIYDPKDDGVTHINVYSKGKTDLGRALSNFAHLPFHHPIHGYFASIEAFWYWLSTGGQRNELRALYGYQAKEAGRVVREELKKNGGLVDVKDFKAQIKKAILCKIEQNEALRIDLKASTLPLTHYYIWGDQPNIKVSQPHDFAWIYKYISDIRDWLNGKAFKLIVAGSRTICSYDALAEYYQQAQMPAIEIVSGKAKGVDTLGESLAASLEIPVAEFPADWEAEPRAAGFIRNKKMAEYGDAGLLLWDGCSKGTKNMEEQLLKLGKTVKLFEVSC